MAEEELSLTGEEVDLERFVSDEGGIWSLREVEKVRGWNSIEYGVGLSGIRRLYEPPCYRPH